MKKIFYLMMHSIHFYIQLCGTIWLYGKIGRGNIQLRFLISSKDSFIFTIPIDRIMHIIAFVTSVADHWLERERGSTMQDRFDDLLHHEWMLYHRATSRSWLNRSAQGLFLKLCGGGTDWVTKYSLDTWLIWGWSPSMGCIILLSLLCKKKMGADLLHNTS